MATLKIYLAVMLGGAVGTGLRMGLTAWLAAKCGDHFPIGTIVVNVSGSFVIGIIAALTDAGGALFPAHFTRQVVMVGVLGGFTTFSAFSLQTLNLVSAGEWARAGWNVVLSVALCLAAVWLGHLLGASFQQR
jgi:CrcB protein